MFHQESEILVKSLLHSLAHQHSKVRIATIKVSVYKIFPYTDTQNYAYMYM